MHISAAVWAGQVFAAAQQAIWQYSRAANM